MIRIIFSQAAAIITMGCLYAEPLDSTASPTFFDDGAFRKLQTDQARALQAKGRLIDAGDLTKQLERRSASLTLAKEASPAAPLALRDIYKKYSHSIFSIAEVRDCDGCGKLHVTPYGTAFAITADGVLLTNRHLIEKLASSSSRMVASTSDGTTYPVVEVLVSSKKDDAAAIRIEGSGFKPLPLSVNNHVGTRISVISHPFGSPYTLSEGIVTRLFTQFSTRTMLVSADYAVGSSGAPVMDSDGNVVGMVATAGSLNDQMFVRGCVPSQSLLELITDSDFGTPEEVHDPFATERACLRTTLTAIKQLAQQVKQEKLSFEESQKGFNDLLSVLQHTAAMCPDDPLATEISTIVDSLNKLPRNQPVADQPTTAPNSKVESSEKSKTDSEMRPQ